MLVFVLLVVQLLLPLGLLVSLARFPLTSVLGLWIQIIATGLVLLALAWSGMWVMPPWWTPYLLGVLWGASVALAAWRRGPARPFWPARSREWASLAVLRLIIAADELRPEVRRIIEFMNGQLRTIQVFGLEVRCFGDDPDTGVVVPFLVGRTQAVVDEKAKTRPLLTWTPDELRRFYESQGWRCERTLRILTWAIERNCTLFGKTQTPMFSVRGRSGERLVGVYPNGLYVILRPSHYPGGAAERDQLVQELKGVGLYPEDLDPGTVTDGRSLSCSTAEMTDEEFDLLLGILSRYCGN